MIKKDDWRLSKDVAHLKNADLNPTCGEDILKHAPQLKRCEFCLKPVEYNAYQWWFITTNLADCICEECYDDFCKSFEWKKLDGWDINWN